MQKGNGCLENVAESMVAGSKLGGKWEENGMGGTIEEVSFSLLVGYEPTIITLFISFFFYSSLFYC